MYRLLNIYPRSLLFAIAAQYFNEGLNLMRQLCMKDLYKREFEVEPQTLQVYSYLIYLPNLLKVFIGIVIDTKVFGKRKYVLVLFGLITVIV